MSEAEEAAATIALPNNNNDNEDSSNGNNNPVVVREQVFKHVDIMCHIFSFLGGGNIGVNIDDHWPHYPFHTGSLPGPPYEDQTQFAGAVRLCIQLSLVCKGWKNICDTNLTSIVGPIALYQFDLNACCRNDFSNLHWIARFEANPLQIHLLDLWALEYKRQLEVLIEILTHCNLTSLRYVRLKLCEGTTTELTTNRINHESHEVMIDLYSRLLNQVVSTSPVFDVLDLDFYINTSTLGTAGGTPTATTTYNTTSTLQDCYNAMVLDSLFSTKPINVGHLHLSIYGINNNNSMPTAPTNMIDWNPNNLLIDKLPSLVQLKLSGRTSQQQQQSFSFLKISSSKSLRILDVVQLYDTPVLISNCPNLQRYNFNTCNGSGSIPLIETQNDFNNFPYDYYGWDGSYGTKAELKVPFLPGLDDLPDTCEIGLFSFGRWYQRRREEHDRELIDWKSPTGFHELEGMQIDWLARMQFLQQ